MATKKIHIALSLRKCNPNTNQKVKEEEGQKAEMFLWEPVQVSVSLLLHRLLWQGILESYPKQKLGRVEPGRMCLSAAELREAHLLCRFHECLLLLSELHLLHKWQVNFRCISQNINVARLLVNKILQSDFVFVSLCMYLFICAHYMQNKVTALWCVCTNRKWYHLHSIVNVILWDLLTLLVYFRHMKARGSRIIKTTLICLLIAKNKIKKKKKKSQLAKLCLTCRGFGNASVTF